MGGLLDIHKRLRRVHLEADRQLLQLALRGHQGQRELFEVDCIADGGCLLDLLHAWLRREGRPALRRRRSGQLRTARAPRRTKVLGLQTACRLLLPCWCQKYTCGVQAALFGLVPQHMAWRHCCRRGKNASKTCDAAGYGR